MRRVRMSVASLKSIGRVGYNVLDNDRMDILFYPAGRKARLAESSAKKSRPASSRTDPKAARSPKVALPRAEGQASQEVHDGRCTAGRRFRRHGTRRLQVREEEAHALVGGAR